MKKRIVCGLLLLAFCGCGSSAEPTLVGNLNSVPPEIAGIFSKPLYENSVWGLRVVDTTTGEVLVDQQADTSFYIGSVRKIFSVGLLLDALGAQHTYDTPVFRQGTVDNAGVLDGDLVLVASGDLTMGGRNNPDGSVALPDYDHNEANSLGNAVLAAPDPLAGYKELAHQVAQSGITRVTGDVVVDDRLFQPFEFRDEFQARSIFVNDDVVDLTLNPGMPGGAAGLEVRPQSAALAVVNSLLTGAAGSEFDVELDPEIPDDIGTPGAQVEVQGTLPVDFVPPLTGEFPLVRTIRIARPDNYARTVLVEALENEGVTVDADTVKENPVDLLPPAGSYLSSDRVALLVGTRYGELARYILKVSYNLGADTSLVLLGLTQGVDNIEGALAVEGQILSSEFGLSLSDHNFVDGSGGGETRATTSTVTTFLLKALGLSNAQVFYDALPILGVDGSLGFVTDFQSDSSLAGATGRVHAKTGTFLEADSDGLIVRGQAFGGYIDTQSGRRLAYMLVVNNVRVEGIDTLLQIFQDEGTISALLWRDF